MSSGFNIQDGTGRIIWDAVRGYVLACPGSSTIFNATTGVPTNGTSGYAPGCLWVNWLSTNTGAGNFFFNSGTGTSSLWTDVDFAATTPEVQLKTLNQTTGTIPAGYLTGAYSSYIIQTNSTPGNQQVRTAAQLLADANAPVGYTGFFRVTNTGAGTMTITADAGATVTLTGTMTIVTNTFRDFVITFPTATTATITTIGVGTYS